MAGRTRNTAFMAEARGNGYFELKNKNKNMGLSDFEKSIINRLIYQTLDAVNKAKSKQHDVDSKGKDVCPN